MACATEILDSGELLNADGTLSESGYAFSQVKTYRRDAIGGEQSRIKEWDRYYFGDGRHAVILTVTDLRHTSSVSVTVLDFPHLRFYKKTKSGIIRSAALPESCATGDVVCESGGVKIVFGNEDGKRRLGCEFRNFVDKRDFLCDIVLEKNTGDNITVAIPFDKPHEFCYNTKLNCLGGSGWYRIGDEKSEFGHGACGMLDWGRGVLPKKYVLYRSSMSTYIDGTPFGFNLGYGFGRPIGSENALFFGGKAHKLNNVRFDIQYTQGERDYLKPWNITDDGDRLNLIFYPMIDECDDRIVSRLRRDAHRVHGKFYGKATLDDGTIIDVSDKIGYAERIEEIR